jgi:hypothetical protein
MNGFTHVLRAQLDTLVIVTNCLNGFALNDYYVFEISSSADSIGELTPKGPYESPFDAIDVANSLVLEIARFAASIPPEPGGAS